MIHRILKGAATVASLPVYLVGNALMVPLLKRQLEREKRRADSLATERNRYRPIAESAEIWMPRIEAERDEAQRKLNLANATVYEQIEALRERDAENQRVCDMLNGVTMAAKMLREEYVRARKWSSLWHERARCYRTAMNRALDAERCAYENLEASTAEARQVAEWTAANQAAWVAAEERAEKAEGAMAAQDERERLAGERCGISTEEHGCDWPDAVAERVVHLRDRLHDAKAAEYQTLQSEVAAAHVVLDRTTAAKGTTLADRVRQHVELYENAIGVYRDDLRKVEGQLEALRSAASEFLLAVHRAQSVADIRAIDATKTDALRAALDGTPPVQDAPPTNDEARAHMRSMSEPFFSARRRAAVEGDHPANDPVTQQWAEAVRHVTAERDVLRREVDTLRRELAEADGVHDGVVAELKARHREVLAERDQTIARLRTKGGRP